ncbi:hypothetical protein SAY87_023195 [Trapa incisa]|uniref:RING-type E3 ubiquitin transferase n=1 Tax=Trapa incisa TaxID=236973 RepID=A0AAN7K7S0_9MYRT|nr:hypothetical protein SAY87_023195 [Trapa incisa]
MDELLGRRAVAKLHPTNRSSLGARDTSCLLSHGHQLHNRPSSSRRLHQMKAALDERCTCGSPHKTKSERSSACLFASIAGSSSRNGSSVSPMRNPKKEAKKKIALQLETDDLGESSKKGISVMEIGSSSSRSALISRSRNQPFSTAKGVKQQHVNPGQCGLRNSGCNAMVHVLSSSSNSEHNQTLNKRKDLLNGRITEGETSTCRGKKTVKTLLSSRNGLSISDSRRNRNYGRSEAHQNLPPVRLSRSSGSPGQRNMAFSLNEAWFTFSRLPRQDLSHDLSDESVSRHFVVSNGMENSSKFSSGLRLPNPYSLSTASHLPTHWENFQQHAMEGISEVLSALERIEGGDSIFEQLVSLDTSLLLLNSLNIFDQHQDMRMDIDNMTYEELLALEERMGTVSTALTEEALLKCLKRESYQKTKCDKEDAANVEKDDTKCSICQEEYMDGDEVGRMQCEHMYHVDCINQWLRVKNWCPVCKSSAEPSPRP